MTITEKILAPNINKLAFILPLGHKTGSGGTWKLYLNLSNRYLLFILFLNLVPNFVLLAPVVYVVLLVPTLDGFDRISDIKEPWLIIGFIAYSLFTFKIVLDEIRLAYFILTRKYLYLNEDGIKHIALKHKTLPFYK